MVVVGRVGGCGSSGSKMEKLGNSEVTELLRKQNLFIR